MSSRASLKMSRKRRSRTFGADFKLFTMRFIRYFWAFPLTFFGVLPAFLVWAFRGRICLHSGAIEVFGPFADYVLQRKPFNFAAVTIGHIIIARDADCCARTRTHEREHVRQGERWGVLFPFAYCGAGFWQTLLGRRFYWDNPFEIAARKAQAHSEREV